MPERGRWWLLVAGLMVAAAGVAAPPSAADCRSAGFATVLEPVHAGSPVDARAVWLDAGRLRWPGKPAHSRYRLFVSDRGRIETTIGERVRGAGRTLRLELATGPLAADLATHFNYLGAGVELGLREHDRSRLRDYLRAQLVLAEVDAGERVLDATHLQPAAALDTLYAEAAEQQRLGVEITPAQTRIAVWAPTARRLALCLHAAESPAATQVLPMRRDRKSGVWSIGLHGDRANQTYTLLVDGYVRGHGLVRNRVTDPYSLSLDADSKHSWIGSLDAADTMPDEWKADRSPAPIAAATDMRIYELHLRDFSVNDASVPAAHRGKYLAFTDAASDGMRHLRALAVAGMTDLHLLPVFDIATIPETGCPTPWPNGPPAGEQQQAMIAATRERDCYNWGYEPLHYTAPEGSYASDAADPRVRIREFRRMVMAVHGIGLRVGMDVVYNHTSAAGQDGKSVLDRIVPDYYHRLDANGAIERSTCCANTATEQRMMARLMRDSVATWARAYHIDSFRFDLMGHQPRAAMEAVQVAADSARGQHVVLLGEGWNFGEVADGARFVQASQRSLNGSGIATFSDRARDAVRGGGCCDSGLDLLANQGYVNGLHYAPNTQAQGRATRADLLRAADLVRVGLAGTLRDFSMQVATGQVETLDHIDYAGQPAGYASEPGEVVNYVENHDNPTLFDINVLKLPPSTSAEERARVQILAAAIPMFSQGIAYFPAGIEGLRSKSLDRNSYDSGDWFNRIDWRFRDNGFGSGLPPAADNGKDWPLLRPLLADPALKPSSEVIQWTRDAFFDLLRLRASSSLFRLRSAEEVRKRLHFLNTGPDQIATLVVAHLDGDGLAGTRFRELMVFVNVDLHAADFRAQGERDRPWQLHPAQAGSEAADARVRDEARFDAGSGRFHVPARSAVVFVIE
ncbi:alpha-1,6-glucosidase domain-containing protein [Dokdonella immobilis]|uniref:Alpha-1,6-glucosidases, pullulanase-type n=1 Tax=Dokdonella immobilis TaxID=578942 RepID=A0A1I4W9J5_9GAMM|nr:alpha-1,6-glucosidase domain-containing protein [Dokdonella immobilis]SFN10135.1 alpha-1,6-glucosidases, pullulanase-type [Dokdonella immobilis]